PIGSEPAPPPGEPSPTALSGFDYGYGRALDWRLVGDGSRRPGPAAVWGRLRGPVGGGGPASPGAQVVALADPGNGVSWVLDGERWSFVNVALTVHLVRPPVGEWVGLAASTQVDGGGVALASSVLYDAGGRIGTGAQSLLVAPR